MTMSKTKETKCISSAVSGNPKRFIKKTSLGSISQCHTYTAGWRRIYQNSCLYMHFNFTLNAFSAFAPFAEKPHLKVKVIIKPTNKLKVTMSTFFTLNRLTFGFGDSLGFPIFTGEFFSCSASGVYVLS